MSIPTPEETARDVLNSLSSKPFPGSHAWTEVVNAIAEALRQHVTAERERCCKAVCPKCAAGDKPVGGWHGGTNGAWRCPAAAIRAESE